MNDTKEKHAIFTPGPWVMVQEELGIALSKAEGNLNHLARESNQSDWGGSITQGEAILNALNAVQQARKAWQAVLHEERKGKQ